MNFNRPTIEQFLLSILLIGAMFVVGACSEDGKGEPSEQPTTAPAPPPTDTAVTQPATENEPDTNTAEEPATVVKDTGPVDVVDTLINGGNFTQLVAAIQSAGLEEKLRAEGPFTIVAPTDAAFATLPADVLNDSELLFDVLLYHVIAGELSSGDIANQAFITTLLGDDLGVTVDGATIRLDGAVVTARDIDATNGTVHVIDTVLLPPSSGLLDSSVGPRLALSIADYVRN